MMLPMALYHIEIQSLKSSKIYYLAKTIRLNDKVLKVRQKLGNTPPSKNEKKDLISKPNLSLEIKALEKKISFGEKAYKTKYLQREKVRKLEESKYWNYMFSLFLTSSEQEYYETNNEIEYVHGTTAIEGNTFSLQQVDELLFKEVPPSDKSLREINEVQNYKMVQKIRETYNGKVTIPFIKKLHKIIMNKIDTESPGRFRRIDTIGIRGVDIAVCPAILIEDELQKIIENFYSSIKEGSHPFEEAVTFHYGFETIHPFTDGNGRVGREILNHMLTRAGFPRLIITKKDREKYLKSLQYGNQEKYEHMLSEFLEIFEDKRSLVFNEIISGKLT
jgi:Fic family protein